MIIPGEIPLSVHSLLYIDSVYTRGKSSSAAPFHYTTTKCHSRFKTAKASNMPSASNSNSAPIASACDVLKPRANFPTSGAVAAKAREQMNAGKTTASSSSTGSSRAETHEQSGSGSDASGDASDPGQKHSVSVQQMQMHEVDDDGVRTWRRIIVEYS
ncbi:hypothetical protein N7495_002481 [Penicillium taxi]|uniref:uncharacterized protein n=1 Tax=Penicillium taxi TaxID=168475 RepID=UPI00254512B3|nr:uncharacterized protein N7495_002481 [Penicillium taxi]KAJ5901953.1 hypothetical protein N7495_002481 [Penicillium taxi]